MDTIRYFCLSLTENTKVRTSFFIRPKMTDHVKQWNQQDLRHSVTHTTLNGCCTKKRFIWIRMGIFKGAGSTGDFNSPFRMN